MAELKVAISVLVVPPEEPGTVLKAQLLVLLQEGLVDPLLSHVPLEANETLGSEIKIEEITIKDIIFLKAGPHLFESYKLLYYKKNGNESLIQFFYN